MEGRCNVKELSAAHLLWPPPCPPPQPLPIPIPSLDSTHLHPLPNRRSTRPLPKPPPFSFLFSDRHLSPYHPHILLLLHLESPAVSSLSPLPPGAASRLVPLYDEPPPIVIEGYFFASLSVHSMTATMAWLFLFFIFCKNWP